MKLSSLLIAVSLLLSFVSVSVSVTVAEPARGEWSVSDPPRPLFRAMEWREVGPYRGGRSAAVAGIPSDPMTYYFGGAGGGVFKTQDAGAHWTNISDGYFGGSIGAVAVSAWDPNVIYVGGGEKTVRGNVSHGDGVYRSTDAGRTWNHVGLGESRHIPRIRIHPRNPDLVYVAALGHLFGPNEQRGVFRSADGGATWERVLFVNSEVGCVDLAMDPSNPRVLYAAMWRVRRTPYSLDSGGEGSGIYKSTDGGTTWTDLSDNEGLPAAPLGIAGITVSPGNSDNLYAIIEAEEGGVFRSRDGGKTWTRTNKERKLRQRAWYYTRIYADPADEDSVYVLNVRFHKSRDGGKSFSPIAPPHGDNHDLWIDPGNPQRMIQSNDGGANISLDGGRSWSAQTNQPTAQMYRVSVDNAFPYRLLGGQQDNSSLRIRHRSTQSGGIGSRDWDPTAGGESGHIVAKPDDPEIVFGGSYGGTLIMFNHRTGERRAVNVWPDNPMGWGAADLRYRFQWNFPLFFSPHDPERLYAAANVLFVSEDLGASWQAISPDLTRADRSKLGSSGGPITQDNTSVEYYATIFAAAESPHEAGVIWTGSDDGRVHVTRDGGAEWQDVTPRKGFPEWMQINGIEIDPRRPGGLYLAGTRYKLDDFEPYLFHTDDYGKSWRRIDGGIPRNHFTRAIRADPDMPGLLYAGTERGVYVSFDDGKQWESLQLNLPLVPITDLAIKGQDLIAATQGRGYWILDDLTPLHEVPTIEDDATARLLTPRDSYRLGGGRSRDPRFMGQNPPSGVVFHYWLQDEPAADVEVTLDLLEPDGTLIKSFTRKPANDDDDENEESSDDEGEDLAQLETDEGLNRFVWDLQYPEAEGFPGLVMWNGSLQGPRARPGDYRARLRVGESVELEVPFRVLADPRSSATSEEFEQQFRFVEGLRDKLTETHTVLRNLRAIRARLKELQAIGEKRQGATPLVERIEALSQSFDDVQQALYQTKMQSPQDPLNFPIRLNDKLSGLMSLARVGDFSPTRQMREVADELTVAIDGQLEAYRELLEQDLLRLNQAIADAGWPAVVTPDGADVSAGAVVRDPAGPGSS